MSVNNRATLAGPRAADGRMARVATTWATEGPRAAQNHESTRGGQIAPVVVDTAIHDPPPE